MPDASSPGRHPEHPLDETSDAGVSRLASLVEELQRLVHDRARLARLPDSLRADLIKACGHLSRPTREGRHAYNKERRRQNRRERREHDRSLLARTKSAVQRLELVYPTPPPEADEPTGPLSGQKLIRARTCYICKAEYRDVHSFYDSLCLTCAAFNLEKRNQTADLRGRVALLTGGRVKIGYQAGIKLLRAGAHLIVTTRFPRDAAVRYAAETDFAEWRDRLDIYGLDLRHTPSVEALLQYIQRRYDRLDFILNNACQTVRRPPGFYAHLMESEELPYAELGDDVRRLVAGHEDLRKSCARTLAPGSALSPLPEGGVAPTNEARADGLPLPSAYDETPIVRPLAGIHSSAGLSQVPLVAGDDDLQMFPGGKLDADLQQVDLREVNSWRLPLAEVPTVELLEVHLVNAVAPFVFNARLKQLMMRTPERDKHIVNVSAMEGQFYRSFKTDKHPHTNMAKASLNMMTRTSAPDYHRDGIHMNSVDTGWITDEDPIHITRRKQEEHGFRPPLDHVDAAARICAPIFDGFLTGEHTWGQFLKDYKPTCW